MASSIPGCSHSSEAPIRGMRMVERTVDSVTFRCIHCGADVHLPRCTATVTKTGERCCSAALGGFVTCTQHRRVESADELPAALR
jgi:hypothetical protein